MKHRHSWSGHSVTEVMAGNVCSESWQTCKCGAERINGQIICPTESVPARQLWKLKSIFPDEDGYKIVHASDTGMLIAVVKNQGSQVVGVAKSNCNLIVAAPQMLLALKMLQHLVVEIYPGHVEPNDEYLEEYKAVWNAISVARSVIAKAEFGDEFIDECGPLHDEIV